ncbi:MAG: hypothetical protein HPM95_10835 [Alphaproteobacteria bacterium]|nr:hypothetical protein [Alphaproteobacteria bacterium]
MVAALDRMTKTLEARTDALTEEAREKLVALSEATSEETDPETQANLAADQAQALRNLAKASVKVLRDIQRGTIDVIKSEAKKGLAYNLLRRPIRWALRVLLGDMLADALNLADLLPSWSEPREQIERILEREPDDAPESKDEDPPGDDD